MVLDVFVGVLRGSSLELQGVYANGESVFEWKTMYRAPAGKQRGICTKE